MGDMADMINDDMLFNEETLHSPGNYMNMTDIELAKETGFVRSEKEKSIRKLALSGVKLSDKQRWCLAFKLYEREMEGLNYE